jgi:hypothetical protein
MKEGEFEKYLSSSEVPGEGKKKGDAAPEEADSIRSVRKQIAETVHMPIEELQKIAEKNKARDEAAAKARAERRAREAASRLKPKPKRPKQRGASQIKDWMHLTPEGYQRIKERLAREREERRLRPPPERKAPEVSTTKGNLEKRRERDRERSRQQGAGRKKQ